MAPLYTRLFDRFKNRASKRSSSAQALDAQDSRLLPSQEVEGQNDVDNSFQDPLPLQTEPGVTLTSAEVRKIQDIIPTFQSPGMSRVVPASKSRLRHIDRTGFLSRSSPQAPHGHSPIFQPSPAYLASFHPLSYPSPIYANGGPDEATQQDTTPPSSFTTSPFSFMPPSSSTNAMTLYSTRRFTRSTASAQSSKSSSTSNPSINSVGFIDQLDKFRYEIELHREMLTASHKCTSCHISLMDLCRLPVPAPAPYLAEARAEPKILGYVLAACAVCLRAYCEGCGKEIKSLNKGICGSQPRPPVARLS
ncbi:hypothetical protein F5146DRAFT_507570 [Armillaria mellea]|nr:hypothetical protein F5146DRAFT_507570 [Armillaria mellea]